LPEITDEEWRKDGAEGKRGIRNGRRAACRNGGTPHQTLLKSKIFFLTHCYLRTKKRCQRRGGKAGKDTTPQRVFRFTRSVRNLYRDKGGDPCNWREQKKLKTPRTN